MTKDVLKFDVGRKGFEKAAIFLIVMAGIFAIFGVVRLYRFNTT